MEGLLKVIEVYPVKNLIVPGVSSDTGDISPNTEALLELCRRKGVDVYRLGKGDNISLGREVRIDFLHPGKEAKADENQNSLVGVLSYGNFKALLTGDIGMETEAKLASGTIASSVLKVPHHGSAGSSSVSFLKSIDPKVSIISVGKNNYGHPSAEALKRLEDSGSLIYRTDEAGGVIVTTDGESIKVKTVR
jgi:competence protein ComEC